MKKTVLTCIGILISIQAFSSGIFNYNGLNYELNNVSKTATLTFQYQESTSNYSSLKKIDIPSKIEYDGESYTVNTIGSWALNRVPASEINLPNTITTIGVESMAVLSNCKTLVIPEGVIEIQQNAFMKGEVERIYLPNSMRIMARGVCAVMPNLKYIEIGSGLESIGPEAFNYTSKIDTIVCKAAVPPQILSSMRDWTFTSTTLNKAILMVPLESLSVYKNNSDWGMFKNIVAISNDDDQNGEQSGDTGEGNTTNGLKYIYNNENTSAHLTYDALKSFDNYKDFNIINVPSTVSKDGIVYQVTEIAPWALNRVCASEIKLPASVTKIGYESMARIPNVKKFTVPNGVKVIDENAFMGSSFEYLEIPETVTELGYGVCAEMNKLKNVVIGSSVTTIGGEAFNYSDNIETIDVLAIYPPETLKGRSVTFTDKTFTNAILYVPYESIGMYKAHSTWGKFKNIKSLESKIKDSAELPTYKDKVLIDGIYYYLYPKTNTATATYNLYQDYRNYLNLETIIVPASFVYEGIEYTVTKIGESAFDRCYHVKYISIPETVTEIAKDGYCSNRILTDVVIGNNVTSIGYGAFAYNYKLQYLTIGSSVKTIGGEAFNYDTEIKEIKIYAVNPPQLTSWGNFDSSIYSKAILYVPKGCVNAYKNASGWKNFKNIVEISNTRVEIDGIFYEINENDFTCSVTYETMNLTENYQYLTDITIPEKIDFENNQYTVISIDNHAFSGASISSIILPNTIKNIGISSFSDLYKTIEKFVIPSSVISVAEEAFARSNIKEIVFGEKVTTIGSAACLNMPKLVKVSLGESVAQLGRTVFNYSDNIVEINSLAIIPPAVAESEDMFSETVYKNAVLRVPVKSMTDYRSAEVWKNFMKIKSLKSDSEPILVDGIYYIIDEEDCIATVTYELYDNDMNYQDYDYISIPEFILLNNVKYDVIGIDEWAFAKSIKLNTIALPSSIVSISENAFSGSNVESIICNSDSPAIMDNGGVNVFDEITYATAVLYVPKNSLTAYKRATGWSNFLDIQTIGVVRVGSVYYKLNQSDYTASTTYQYYQSSKNYENMKSVVIPEKIYWNGHDFTVTKIGASSFDRCYDITNFDIPNSVTEIETDGFCSNHSLTHVVIGENVKKVGYGAFAFNYSLLSLTIGSNVETIGGEAFNYDSELVEVTCLAAVPPVMENGRSTNFSPIAYNNAILYVPQGKVEIYKNSAWGQFKQIKEIVNDMFCMEQTNFTVDTETNEATVTYEQFNDGTNYNTLTDLVINETVSLSSPVYLAKSRESSALTYPVTTIGEHCFNHSSIRSVVLPSTLKKIERLAFSNLDNFIGVEIPNSVTKIGAHAFSNNAVMAKVIIGESVDSIGYGAFSYNPSLIEVDLGPNVKHLEGESFSQSDAIEKIIVRAIIPPTIEDGFIASFPSTVYRNATLYVPENSIETYSNAYGWKLFNNIKPIDVSSVDSIRIEDSNIIKFKDIPLTGEIVVYSLTGNKIYKGKKMDFSPLEGIFIVSYNGNSMKIKF